MKVDSGLYSLLPPDKKEEYIDIFKVPIPLSVVIIDESVPIGWVRFDGKLIKLPERM